MSLTYRYQFENDDSPFWAFAIHDGHQVDAHLMPYMNIAEEERLREEDPYTAILAELPCNRFVSGTSRFQLDLLFIFCLSNLGGYRYGEQIYPMN